MRKLNAGVFAQPRPLPDVRLLRRWDFPVIIVSSDASDTRKGDY